MAWAGLGRVGRKRAVCFLGVSRHHTDGGASCGWGLCAVVFWEQFEEAGPPRVLFFLLALDGDDGRLLHFLERQDVEVLEERTDHEVLLV